MRITELTGGVWWSYMYVEVSKLYVARQYGRGLAVLDRFPVWLCITYNLQYRLCKYNQYYNQTSMLHTNANVYMRLLRTPFDRQAVA